MEKLADNLQKLGEDDLLQVVEMVHNNKTADTYTKNDVERKPDRPPYLLSIYPFWRCFSLMFPPPSLPSAVKKRKKERKLHLTFEISSQTEGEFHVDLYTLPDSLIRMLWDFSQEKLGT